MSKKHFVALANLIRSTRASHEWTEKQIHELASFLDGQNPRFNRKRWLEYIAGTVGPNGGKPLACH